MVHGSDLFCRGGDHQGPQPSAANSTGFLRIKRTDATEEVAAAAWAETEAMESMSSDDDEDQLQQPLLQRHLSPLKPVPERMSSKKKLQKKEKAQQKEAADKDTEMAEQARKIAIGGPVAALLADMVSHILNFKINVLNF